MSEYSNQYFHTPVELDFPSVEYQGNGSFEEYVAELIQSRHIVGANGSALTDNDFAKAMELFDDAVETAFFTTMYPRGRGNEIPFYIAPAIVSQAKDMDGNFVFGCDRYAICSRSEMSFGEIREAFRMIDVDEVTSYIADCFEDNLLEFLKQSAPAMPTHASSAASAAVVGPVEVQSTEVVEEAEVVSVETVQPIAAEPAKPRSSVPSRRSKPNSEFTMTPTFLYLHFADALAIDNIQSAKENTFYVEGNSVVLNSLEYDDEEGVQRTIVKYDLGGKKKTLYTTVASKDGTIVRYDWRSCAKYAWALEQGVDDDGNFTADTLSQAMTRDACDKPLWKSKGVTFVPTPPAEAAAAKGNSPKIKNAYGETQGELWKVLNEDEDGQQWDSFYYLCDPSAQRSTVIEIEHGSVSDRQLCLLDGTDEEGRKGLRLLLVEWEAELLTDYPLDVMTMLMVLGVAPKPEAVTQPKPVEEVAVEEIIETANAEPETAEANVEPINTEEVETPVVTQEVVDDDPIAAMQRLAEELRKKQEAEMAAMMQQIQQAQEEKRRKEEEARRKAEEEAKRKAAEEEARRKAEEERKKREAEEARRKAEEEAKRKAAEEEARRKAEEDASAAATSAAVQTQPSDDDEEIRCLQFDEILMWVKKGIPVVLWGPAGTGKDITCMQVAKALGVPYHSINAVLDTFEAFGYTDGHGVFHGTELTRSWVDGGLCGCTELFASDPQVLNTLNEALSNGYMIINGKRVKKHPQCYIMASDNTVGTGGTSMYTGRRRIDEATLNRFILIEVSYDHRVELRIANGNAAAVEFMEDFRNACNECGGLDIVRSYRQTKMFVEGLDADGLRSVKWTPAAPYIKTAEEQCIHRCFHRYMSDDDFVLIASKLRCVRNAYTRAMRSMAEAIKTA